MTVKQTTISEFMKIMGGMPKSFERQLMRFTFMIATDVRREAIVNAKRNFGMTARNNSRGVAIAPSRGGLISSILVAVVGKYPGVTIGNITVPYAAIHEFGGVIKPKNAKYLTIPQDPFFVGKRAREFDLSVVRAKSGNLYLVQKNTGVFAYLLKKSVTMPARPYLSPAMDYVVKSDKTKQNAEKLLGGMIVT